MPACADVKFIEGRYEPSEFYEAAKGLEDAPEGGERCLKCFELRLNEAAKTAAEQERSMCALPLQLAL